MQRNSLPWANLGTQRFIVLHEIDRADFFGKGICTERLGEIAARVATP
jgi:hypothetical protein